MVCGWRCCLADDAQGGNTGDAQFLASSVLGVWHFVSLTFDGDSNMVSAYIDGQLGAALASGDVPVRSSPLFVGASSSGLLNSFTGNLYDLRIYNRELSGSELRQLWAEMSHKLQVRKFARRCDSKPRSSATIAHSTRLSGPGCDAVDCAVWRQQLERLRGVRLVRVVGVHEGEFSVE